MNQMKTMEEEGDWRVRVFRKSVASGWECLKVSLTPPPTLSTTNSTAAQGKNAGRCRTSHIVRASVQKGAIVIRKLRLRIALKQETIVSRRHNCLRIQSQQGVRILILRFDSVKDCLSFSDNLIKLNPLSVRDSEQTSLYDQLSRQNASEQDREAVLLYVARLFYDADFMSTVNSFEKALIDLPGGQEILDDMAKGELPNETEESRNQSGTVLADSAG